MAKCALDIAAHSGAPLILDSINGGEQAVDGDGNLGRYALLLDGLEFLLGGLCFSQCGVGAGNLGAGADMIGIDGEHALQGENGIGVFAGLQGRQAKEEIVFWIAGALGLEWLEQGIGSLGVTPVEERLGIVGDCIGPSHACGHHASRKQRDPNHIFRILHLTSFPAIGLPGKPDTQFQQQRIWVPQNTKWHCRIFSCIQP